MFYFYRPSRSTVIQLNQKNLPMMFSLSIKSMRFRDEIKGIFNIIIKRMPKIK